MSALTTYDVLFHAFAAIATVGAILVITVRNPIYSALFLALTMSVLGAIFFTLEAYFVAAAQITVYAGAVMVLFVMVLMLFDLKHETEEILKISPLNLSKILAVSIMCGFFIGTGWLAVTAVRHNPGTQVAPQTKPTDLVKKELPPTRLGNPDEDLTEAERAALVDNKKAGEPDAALEAAVAQPEASPLEEEFGSTVSLSRLLFTKYVFAFEAVSLLLLVAIVGAVALAKSRGGTHHVAK